MGSLASSVVATPKTSALNKIVKQGLQSAGVPAIFEPVVVDR